MERLYTRLMFFDTFVKYIFEKFILRTNTKVYEIYYMCILKLRFICWVVNCEFKLTVSSSSKMEIELLFYLYLASFFNEKLESFIIYIN